MPVARQIVFISAAVLSLGSVLWQQPIPPNPQLNARLIAVLHQKHFTGAVPSSLREQIGRDLNLDLANLGRLLWFDTITGLNNDNTCAGSSTATNRRDEGNHQLI